MIKRTSDISRTQSSCRFLALPPAHCCTIVESVREGVITFDPQKTVIYANPAAEAITGFPAGSMIGRKCFDVLQSELCRRRCPVDDLLSGGQSHIERQTRIIDQTGGPARLVRAGRRRHPLPG